MKTELMNNSPMKHVSAWLPLTMSLAVLAMVVGHAAIFGVVHEADEGTAAHVFQLLLALQIPDVAYFALNWLPKQPRRALQILALQAGAGLAAIAAAYWLT